MLTKRIVPCLDVKDGRVVKGIRFRELRDAGNPADLAEVYQGEGADELVFLDISASAERRSTRRDWVSAVADRLCIPFTVGGGISSEEEAVELVALGADKISLNTAAVRRPALLSECARRLGCQAVVAAVDVRRQGEGWEVVIEGGRTPTGLDALAWWKEGKMDEIIAYCRQDVAVTRDLYLFGRDNGYLLFSNKAGKTVRLPVEWS